MKLYDTLRNLQIICQNNKNEKRQKIENDRKARFQFDKQIRKYIESKLPIILLNLSQDEIDELIDNKKYEYGILYDKCMFSIGSISYGLSDEDKEVRHKPSLIESAKNKNFQQFAYDLSLKEYNHIMNLNEQSINLTNDDGYYAKHIHEGFNRLVGPPGKEYEVLFVHTFNHKIGYKKQLKITFVAYVDYNEKLVRLSTSMKVHL